MPPRLQLVIPCYNEAGRLKPEAFLDVAGNGREISFVFVDDGSTDQTPAILADVARRGGEKIVVLTLGQNVGKAEAVHRGILAAFERHPEFVGYWDADLATPLAALPDFMDVFRTRPEVDIVMGARVKLLGRNVQRSLMRHYCGRVFATAASFALGIDVYDTQCGAKIFRTTPAVRQIFAAPFRSQWVFDVEILSRYLAAARTEQPESRIFEVPLSTWTAMPGSKLTAWHIVRAIWDLALVSRR
ncbi:MAG TPA: glycosyltransferase [Vicinamibacterales bacterium]|jgi:glycosyltransferase involved in cell wall biosynthesis